MEADKLRIPIARILREVQDRKTLQEIDDIVKLGPEISVIRDDDLASLLSGLGSSSQRIIVDYFELTEQLISKSYIEFPDSDPNFTSEVINKAKILQMSPVAIPGFSGVPRITQLLKTGEIDEDIYALLWKFIAPNTPHPMPSSLSRRIDSGPLLENPPGKGLRRGLLEDDGKTPYQLTFHQSHFILVEDFPDVKQLVHTNPDHTIVYDPTPPPAADSELLNLLNLSRTNIYYDTVQTAIEDRGSKVLEFLDLNPSEYHLHLLRYEDFSRLGSRRNWGIGPYYTYLQGWVVQDNTQFYDKEEKLIKQRFIAGESWWEDRNVGLNHFASLGRNSNPDEWLANHVGKADKVIVRFAVSHN